MESKSAPCWHEMVKAATAAYWHPCFKDNCIDAPERMEAALAVVVQHLEPNLNHDSL